MASQEISAAADTGNRFSQKRPRDDLTAEYVRSILDYDPETGILTWKPRANLTKHQKIWNKRYTGPNREQKPCKSYRTIRIGGRVYKVHRVAWLHYYGCWPDGFLDHRDTNRSNNRIKNLREASNAQNVRNGKRRFDNEAGIKGISFLAKKGKWRARIGANGAKHLGFFDTAEEAQQAYEVAASQRYGEFARME